MFFLLVGIANSLIENLKEIVVLKSENTALKSENT
jgi:hypothetical protein